MQYKGASIMAWIKHDGLLCHHIMSSLTQFLFLFAVNIWQEPERSTIEKQGRAGVGGGGGGAEFKYIQGRAHVAEVVSMTI